MTTVFPPSGNADTTSPGTHVLIIGLGGYPHVLGGDPKQLTNEPMGLQQLSSPPVSADAVADWFLGRDADPQAKRGFQNPTSPLASIEMLVSPPWAPKDKAQPHRYRLAGGDEIVVDGGSREKISSCYATWLGRVKSNAANIGVFYFCGHGVTGLNDYVLPEDFGHDPLNPWHDAIDIATTARAARRAVAGALYFLIDACREAKQEALAPGAQAQPLESVAFKKPVQCFSRLMLWATAEGRQAHGAEGKPSRFTSALLHALSGSYGEPLPEGRGWVVSSTGLAQEVDRILEDENASVPAAVRQHIEEERIGSQPFQYETKQPERVGAMVSIALVYPHAREVLDALPGAQTLPPLVKETIAEHVESGRLPLDQLQKEVDRWSHDIAVWAERFAAEPDRGVAEQANTVLAAGKLNEAGALFDRLIRAAEARVVAEHARLGSYYASRAEVLMLQLKWREAVPYLEKALENAQQIHGDTAHPTVAALMNNLGEASRRLGESHKSVEYFTQALAIARKVFGDAPHPLIGTVLTDLGLAQLELGEFLKALEYLTTALAIDRQVYGDAPHAEVAADLNNLGAAWSRMGEHGKAIDYYNQALLIDQKVHGDVPNPDLGRALHNLGEAYRQLGEYPKAVEYFTRALAVDQQVYGETPHPDTSTVLTNLGIAQVQLGEFHNAIEHLTAALAMDRKLYGEAPHPALANDLEALGAGWETHGDYEKAIDYYLQALAMFEVTVPADDPGLQMTRANLAGAQLKQAAAK